jgi:hypothetical protein
LCYLDGLQIKKAWKNLCFFVLSVFVVQTGKQPMQRTQEIRRQSEKKRMKKVLLPLILPVALLTGIIYSCSEAQSQKAKAQSTNAITGDENYVSKFGHTPEEPASEDPRISCEVSVMSGNSKLAPNPR